jgi:hypothetical protein
MIRSGLKMKKVSTVSFGYVLATYHTALRSALLYSASPYVSRLALSTGT